MTPEDPIHTLEKLAIHNRLKDMEAKFDVLLTEIKFRDTGTLEFRKEIRTEFEEVCSTIKDARQEIKDVRHSINGTANTIGLAEQVRNLIKWANSVKAAWIALGMLALDWITRHWPGVK